VASTLFAETGKIVPDEIFLKITEEESSARITEISPVLPTNRARQVTERSIESFGIIEKPLRAGLVSAVAWFLKGSVMAILLIKENFINSFEIRFSRSQADAHKRK
jgi:hypothetical protein